MWVELMRQQKISENIQNNKEQMKNVKLKKKQYLIKNSLHSTNNRLHKRKEMVGYINRSQQKLSKPKYSEQAD